MAPDFVAFRRFDRLFLPSGRSNPQGSHSGQVVSGGMQRQLPADPVDSSVERFAQSSDGFHPAKALLDPLADFWLKA